eukprot:14909704-Alexandrium_andersonii.AAC.1
MQAGHCRPWYQLASRSQALPPRPRLQRPCALPRREDQDRRMSHPQDRATQDLPPNRCAGASGA